VSGGGKKGESDDRGGGDGGGDSGAGRAAWHGLDRSDYGPWGTVVRVNDGSAAARVRPLTAADVPVFLDLTDALADYERLDRPAPDARERLARDAIGGAGGPKRFETLLADLDGAVVGYAVFFMTYSTFRALPTFYLEDIFVLPEARSRGAGRALFEACAQEAVRRGCGRMEWTVLRWNTPAIEFYDRRGARPLDEWLGYRLDGEALAAFGAAPPTR
jgi:GNAT superfamily N-acetyltransferase